MLQLVLVQNFGTGTILRHISSRAKRWFWRKTIPQLQWKYIKSKYIDYELYIYSEIRDLQKQINQEGPQVPNQVDETMHQRQPPPSNANTTEQPLVQTKGNNEQNETEKREPVSQKQVSESGETGPLTTQ
ncbi:Hypothetical_protein [Hexamita inflata]|uniref:Hypothetical_protein n=1 Tax=Hexamita inflata TaxID=28002 RepID=A0AA86NXU6_9EUKA|nr:Hypothetical protein HINF_LOCUS14735 [Hexamita inflata]